MYRVYDTQKKRWLKYDIYLMPNGDLYKLEKPIFRKRNTLKQLSNERYIVHRDIGLTDKNGILMYEGDICEAMINEDETINAEIAYVDHIASYVLLDYKTGRYYSLGTEQANLIEVVGNVLDTPELLEFEEEVSDDKQPLQESEI